MFLITFAILIELHNPSFRLPIFANPFIIKAILVIIKPNPIAIYARTLKFTDFLFEISIVYLVLGDFRYKVFNIYFSICPSMKKDAIEHLEDFTKNNPT